MDTFTLVVASALAGAILCGSMTLLYLAGWRKPCLLDWALAGLFFACNGIMGASAAHFQTNHFLLIGIGNAAYVAGHFGILAGLRRQLGLDPGWMLLAGVAPLVLVIHVLPFVHGSVTHRLFLFTPLITAINLAVALTPWRHIKRRRGAWAPYLPLAVLELVFMLQLCLRSAYLVAGESQRLTFMGSQFLQTSGSLFVLVFLSVATMSCALIVSHEQSQALRRASLTDALTGWLNRRALHDIASRQFQRCRDAGGGLFFITLDIDHFKAINDGYGHATGDAAIRHVTALADGVLRGADARFRIGGEEFALLLTDAALEDVSAIAERLRALVAASPLEADGRQVAMTVSVGVAVLAPGDRQWEDVLRRADAGMYLAKRDGRNRVGLAPQVQGCGPQALSA